MFANHKRPSRRGIILLVALGLLALFGILIAAYLTFASDSRKAAFNSARRDFRTRDPEHSLHDAMMQILRGTTDPSSALFRQDLLGDYYGYHSTEMAVSAADVNTNGERLAVTALHPLPPLGPQQFPGNDRNRGVLSIGANMVKVPLHFTTAQPFGAPLNTTPENIHNSATFVSPWNLDDALTGRTVTLLAGPLQGMTLPIDRWMGVRDSGHPAYNQRYSMFVHFDLEQLPSNVLLADGSVRPLGELIAAGTNTTVYRSAALFYNAGADGGFGRRGVDDDGNGVADDPAEAGFPGSDDQPYAMVINPIPMNGSGTGIRASDGNTQTLTLANGPTVPIALQPNASRWPTGTTVVGNSDEPYDAPDYENLFLSHTQDFGAGPVIIPSFHRPALVNYLRGLSPNMDTANAAQFQAGVEVIRRGILRPLPIIGENPQFTGGNPNFVLRSPNRLLTNNDFNRLNVLVNSLVNGPWDVDNDGDGVADSVWIDPHLPLVTAPDGTLLRPLIAVKIDDLSARFNLNTHGNVAQLTASYLDNITAPLAGKLAAGSTAVSLPSGRGYGPAEIYPLLNQSDLTQNNQLLDAMFASRYAPGTGTEIADWSTSGTIPPWQRPPSQQPGIRGMVPGYVSNDFQDQRLRPALPQIHNRFTRFGFPLDMYGRGGLGLDASGNLLSSAAGIPLLFDPNTNTSYVDESLNDPYEFDPTGRLAGDTAFRESEMEAVLSGNRWDSHLFAGRIDNLISGASLSDPSVANLVTTYSSSDIRPTSKLVPELRDLGAARLRGTANTTVPTSMIEALLARLIESGSSMNGQIVQADIDLAEALLAPELKMGMPINLNRAVGNGLDDNGNGVIDEPNEIENQFDGVAGTPVYSEPRAYNGTLLETPRQAMARQLYCLVMLIASDEDANLPRWVQDTTNLGTTASQRLYRARRIAQWAVNVVDYRDGDGIMTRFVYDNNLANGWNPNETTNAAETDEVWGCEHPELLFMESFAAHNLRVKDTAFDSSGDDISDGDPHVDQIRMPQGSAYLELYSPRPRTTASAANHEALPTELYGVEANVPVLDLDRLAPGVDVNGDGDFDDAGDTPPMPLWRIAVSEPHPELLMEDDKSPLTNAGAFPDTASFDPTKPDELDLTGAPAALALERFVVFSEYSDRAAVQPLADALGVDPSAIFSNLTGGSTNLQVGNYLTVAPRTETIFGALVDGGTPTAPSQQLIRSVAGEGLVHFDTMGNRVTPGVYPADGNGDILEPLVVLAQAFEPPAWGVLNNTSRTEVFGPGNVGIGFNISEPVSGTSYYRLPEDFLLGSGGTFQRRDAYWDYVAGTGTSGGNPSTPPDKPLDLTTGYPIEEFTAALTGTANPDEPFLGTSKNHCTAFLQRLANPTIAFQDDPALPGYNPYRTIDWISMDLTVFSGDELEDTVNGTSQYASETRERTGEARNGGGTENLLYANRLTDPSLGALGPNGVGQPYFSIDLETSLGYLNDAEFGPRHSSATVDGNVGFIGQPQNLPFALHPWLNRPYASPLELMFVPACSQGRLFEEFTLLEEANYYAGTANLSSNPMFGHLLNFFDSVQDQNNGVHLYRIFDYVGTGAKFRGTSMPESPYMAGMMNINNPSAQLAQAFWRQTMQFPLNQRPNYSEQGRINLNTVSDSRVYAGLMWGHLPAAERVAMGQNVWNQFSASRRGYMPTAVSIPGNFAPHLNPSYPTEFLRPFTGWHSSTAQPDITDLRQPWIGGTVMRPQSAGGVGPNYVNNGSLYQRTTTGAHDNVDRSALMRNQTLTRMENLTTNHSNSYLVRITLGYFEVNPSTLDLGREYMSEMGRNQRYRAVYMVDRSIPCNYETGVDNDTEKLILYRRFYKE
jgi:hypothetical protein